jgi:hypothetical protein
MSLYFQTIDEDSFFFLPALILSLGRCECCERVGGARLSLVFMFWEIGIEFPLPSSH